jgi:hypothetical protein
VVKNVNFEEIGKIDEIKAKEYQHKVVENDIKKE